MAGGQRGDDTTGIKGARRVVVFSTRLSELPIFLIKGFLSQTSQWNPVHPSYHYNYKEPGILGLWC